MSAGTTRRRWQFVVLCAVLPVYRLWALLAALGAAVLAFAGAKKICPIRVVETEVPFHTGVDDVDAMLTEMQQQLDTLHALNEALPDPQLSAAMARMEKAGRSIVETVEATPAKAKQVRRFAQLLSARCRERAAAVRQAGKAGGAGRECRLHPRRGGAPTQPPIATAFENQLDALYAAESMDLSAT